MQIFANSHFDFIGKRKPFIRASLILIGISLISIIAHGGPKLGIDFLGGTLIQFRFEPALEIGQVRSSLDKVGMGNAEIKTFADPNEILIYVEQSQENTSAPDRVKAQLTQDYPTVTCEVRRLENVGPRIGKELVGSAFWAIVVSLVLMAIYISFRFEFRFALGATAALAHDVILPLGVFSLLNKEISLDVVAALLTIVGYSLNDTIVIFDRVRENMKLLRRETLDKIMNESINQTLSRTILTNGTVLEVVLALYLFGGDVINGFALAMLIGVIAGCYSTMYIASPVVLWWEERQARAVAAQTAR